MSKHLAITEKMVKVLNSAGPEHQESVNRYMCLSNRRLHQMIENKTADVFAIAGASTAIRGAYQAKYGTFMPEMK